jgi:hypothetical protein
VGFAPTEKRRLLTAHASSGLMHRKNFHQQGDISRPLGAP